jgi:hypothetical protein
VPAPPRVPEAPGIVSQAQGGVGQAAAVPSPAMPETPAPGIVAQAQGAAGQAQGAVPPPPEAPSAPAIVQTAQTAAAEPGQAAQQAGSAAASSGASEIATGVGVGVGAAGIAAAAAAATQTAQAQPEATAVSAVTGAVADHGPGGAHEVADTAHDVSSRVAKGKELPDAAKEAAEKKVEVAALGTKPGEALEQAKGIEEKVAGKLEGARSAKESAEKADKGDDSADIEE